MSRYLFFFFNDPATTEIYTLSLHDALPAAERQPGQWACRAGGRAARRRGPRAPEPCDPGAGRARPGVPPIADRARRPANIRARDARALRATRSAAQARGGGEGDQRRARR